MKKLSGVAAAAAAMCTILVPAIARAQAPDPSGAAAQAPSTATATATATAGVVAPPPPVFVAPAFQPLVPGPDEEPPDTDTPPPDSTAPAQPTRLSRVVLQVDAGAMYRRLYDADISAFQLGLTAGGRVRRVLIASGFVQGAIGSTNQGLQVRHLEVGGELAFPLSRWESGILGRLTPAIRPRVTYTDVERVTTSRRFFGIGLGADFQASMDLWQSGPHAIFAVGRAGLEGFFGDGPAILDISTFWMWGGSLGLGFRY